MTKEGLIFIIGTYLAFFVGYWIGRKHENEKSWVSAHKDVENQLEEKDKRIEGLQNALDDEKEINKEIKSRFVKCNTCTDEMKEKCLMFTENLCEGERCEELVDVMALFQQGESKKKIEELKEQIERMKCCSNCKYYQFPPSYCYKTCTKEGKLQGADYRSCKFDLEFWEMKEDD